MRLPDLIRKWLRLLPRVRKPPRVVRRGPVDHVIILDGTLSSLKPGEETNAGMAYKLLCEMTPAANLSLYYQRGVQWDSWRKAGDVIMGRGINRSIRRAYGVIASRYRPGDRIFLFGYSRGAFAVRSLAGVIDRVGLLQAEHATVRNIRQAYRHYENNNGSEAGRRFAELFCHTEVGIEMIGVWDTVKALGLRVPLLWRLTESRHAFHNHMLSSVVAHGYHALAMDETREVFEPVMWFCPTDWQGDMEQVWFRGAHGDIGGQLGGFSAARPLSNIPFVWMMDKAAGCNLLLPEGWQDRFEQDPDAPAVGTIRSWGKLFLARRRRVIGRDASESIHPTATDHKPKAKVVTVS